MSDELISKSVEHLAPLIKNKTISPVELTEAVLARAQASQDQTNAYLDIYQDEAIASAKRAETDILNGTYHGLYHGIPMGIKDNIYIKHKQTTMGSKIHEHFMPTYDATVVRKLKEAGVIFTGKLHMHEYALSITNNNPHFGPVRNPWDLSKIPGGSSGGSAAAIAVGSSMASIGTDTAGSIRIPASACGIVGLKPTRGKVSTRGVYPLSWTQDHVGPMGKTVKDVAGLLEIVAGYDDQDPASVVHSAGNYLAHITGDVTDLVIGIEEDYFFNHIDSDIEKSVRAHIQHLIDQGATVKPVNIPALKEAEWAGFCLSVSEASMVHHDAILERPNDFGKDIRGFLLSGASPASTEYAQALNAREQLIADFNKAFNEVDVLIAPTLPIMPNDIGDDMVDLNGEKVDLLSNIIRLTGPSNLSGLPALSVPCGFSGDLPIGLQFIGPAFSESRLLNAGYAIEQMNPLQGKTPRL